MQKTQIIFFIFLFVAATAKSMGDSQPSTETKVYIVYTENPEDQEPEEYHIKTLASVLGRFFFFFFSSLSCVIFFLVLILISTNFMFGLLYMN